MYGKVDFATLKVEFWLEIYSNTCVNKSVQNHPKSFFNIAELWDFER